MSRRNEAKEKFADVGPDTVDALFDADPTGGGYGTWMVARVSAGEPRDVVVAAAQAFHEAKRQLPKKERDLYAYADAASVARAAAGTARARRKKRGDDPGYTLLREYPGVAFYRVDSYEGMRTLGRDTKWCTTNRQEWPKYSDNLFVIAVSRLRGKRDPYSKFVMMLRNSYTPAPLQYVKYANLKNKWSYARTDAWSFYDAKDRQPGGFHDAQDRGPIEEILDMLAGETGATRGVLLKAQGGTDHREIFDEHVVPFARAGGHVGRQHLVEVARVVAAHGLFNPLSLLDHPAARRRDACDEVAALATDEQWAALGVGAVRDLLGQPAVNVPEIFDRLVARSREARMCPREVVNLLIENRKLTKATRARVVEHLRSEIFKLD